jgi:glycosyltransferase involved in cell wall biosynthesis
LSRPLRVALFSDSHYEANGVARTTLALERYAARRGWPLLSVHGSQATRTTDEGTTRRLELRRAPLTSFCLEHDLWFDLALWRHTRLVSRTVRAFAPDVLHFTGPSDVGQIGALLGYRLGIPMVGSWHTNLHEYAGRRLRLDWAGRRLAGRARAAAEAGALAACALYYRIPRVILAPNDELANLLHARTGRPVFPMSRGVDTETFTPHRRRRRDDGAVNVGYVGRLSPEKSVRVLAALSTALEADGSPPVRFTIVGHGSERGWLERHLPGHTRFTGTLRGEALAEAYADMDLFVFPSETETVGNVVLEAMASGVPVVAMAIGGPKFVANVPDAVELARDHRDLVGRAVDLVRDPVRRRRMGIRGRAHACDLSWDRIFDGVYRVYAFAFAAARGAAPVVDGQLAGELDA